MSDNKGCECMKAKSIICGTIAGVVAAFALTPFLYTSAYDLPTGTVHVDSATIKGWIGDTVSAQYLGSDGEYHATTASYLGIQYISGANMQGLTANNYNGRSVLWYGVPYPSDAMTAYSFSPVAIITPNIHLSNVTYCDFGFAFHLSNKFLNVSYNSVLPYCYVDYYYGSAGTLYAAEGATGNLVGHLGSYSIVGSNYYGGNMLVLEGSATDFYLSSISGACGGTYNGQLVFGIAVCDMILNSDYILEENAPPPGGGGGDTPSFSGTGSMHGTATENSDGGYDINYEINIEMPDYTPYINPDWNEAQADRVNSARANVDEYQTLEDDLLLEVDDNLSSLPDMEFDDTLIEDGYNPFSEFFGINIVGIMVFWVGAIAFISYILFGKWV